jgi:hypothetical protein
MAGDWNERWKRQAEDERIYRAIRTGDWKTALMELFKEVRQVDICKHGNMTTDQQCPKCADELDLDGL